MYQSHLLNSAQKSPFDRTGNNRTCPDTSYLPRDSTRGMLILRSIRSFWKSNHIHYIASSSYVRFLKCYYKSYIFTHRYVTSHFFNRIVGSALHNNIGEQRLDANRTGVVLHGHLVDVQRFEGRNTQFG